ncbi:DUF1127 domain-containing protein [Marivita sp.]|uniref:DUF1127 domain-containing protein n=1 Tax=Marivita sp. TaxID=2003365 RepID=UPI0025BDBE5E|nr:DUF1127 domain-containing protein [Marivita sp.]
MAHTQTFQGQKPSFLANLIEGLTRGMGQVMDANSRIREVERLQMLSDESLAAKGIKREEITRHVFRDVFWM